MKQKINRIAAALMAVTLLFASASCGNKVQDGEYDINVCAYSDLHGKYFDSTYISEALNPTSLSNISSYLKELRAEHPHVILIDNGDALQGDNAAYYYNYVRTEGNHVYSEIVEYLGVDAIAVGNHDVEAGPAVYNKIRKGFKGAYMGANTVRTEGTDAGKPFFDEYAVIERDGIKIAVVGYTNPNIKSWISADHYAGFDILPADLESVQALVDRVNAKVNPAATILSIHAGTGTGEATDFENPSLYLAKNLNGVDLVICGHDHTPRIENVENPNGTVVLMNPGSHGRFVGNCTMHLKFEKGKVVEKSLEAENVSMKEQPVDPEYDAFFAERYKAVKDFTNKKVGTLKCDLDLAEAYEGPSAYINLLHDIQLKAAGADISFAAPLGKRNLIEAGDVVYNDLLILYPYENQLYAIEMTGKQIKDYLELSFYNWINHIGPAFNYDSARGIIYNVHRNAPMGEIVEILSMEDGTPFDLDKRYKVALTSYRAMGGGNLLRDGAGIDVSDPDSYVVEKYDDIRDMMYRYFTSESEIAPAINTNWKFVE